MFHQQDFGSLQFCCRELLFSPPLDLLFSEMKIMVIWTLFAGEREGRDWIRSGGCLSSAKTGHVGVIEVNHRARWQESRNGYHWGN